MSFRNLKILSFVSMSDCLLCKYALKTWTTYKIYDCRCSKGPFGLRPHNVKTPPWPHHYCDCLQSELNVEKESIYMYMYLPACSFQKVNFGPNCNFCTVPMTPNVQTFYQKRVTRLVTLQEYFVTHIKSPYCAIYKIWNDSCVQFFKVKAINNAA